MIVMTSRSLRLPLAALGLSLVLATLAVPQPAHAAKKAKPAKVNEYAPTLAPLQPVQVANGSIFQTSMGYAPLTSGARASSVGDLVTIILVEATQAQKTNSASTDRSANSCPESTVCLDIDDNSFLSRCTQTLRARLWITRRRGYRSQWPPADARCRELTPYRQRWRGASFVS